MMLLGLPRSTTALCGQIGSFSGLSSTKSPFHQQGRKFFSTPLRLQEQKQHVSTPSSVLATYHGPLMSTFGRLKLFSLASLTLASALCPVLLMAPGELGLPARLGLCVTALATSGASTSLIAWIGKPYVGKMRLVDEESALKLQQKEGMAQSTNSSHPAIEMWTTNWRLRPLLTRVYQPNVIRPTNRPFATWELPMTLPQNGTEKDASIQLIASTTDLRTGKVVGKWWAAHSPDEAQRACREEGKVVRHFSIQEDLLDEKWRVL